MDRMVPVRALSGADRGWTWPSDPPEAFLPGSSDLRLLGRRHGDRGLIGRLLASPATETLGRGWMPAIGFAIYVMGIVGVPLALGIAILRHHLYDIDQIIRRTLVYGSLTVLLAAVYVGSVALTGAVFQALTLRERQPQLVIVVITLA